MSRMQHTPALLASHLKTLRLPTMLRECEAVARQAGESDATYELFLQQLAEVEVQQRQAASIERRLKQASFPTAKELSEFDFRAAPKVNKKRLLELARCRFIEQRSNVVFTGAPGVVTYCYTLLHHWNNWTCASSVPIRGPRLPVLTASIVARTCSRSRSQRSMIQGACGTTCRAGSVPPLIN